jgi:nucleotide-binding universal stress UspA family protein
MILTVSQREETMKKMLIAVDDSRTSREVLSTCATLVREPEEVLLLHVQRLEGRSLMIDMLGDAEMSTLKESLRGTEHQRGLDRKAQKVLAWYRKKLEAMMGVPVRTLLAEGPPADEILRVAREEGVDLIILGKSGKKSLDRLITGSVAVEVEKKAGIPVMTARRRPVCEEPYSWKDACAAFSALTIVVFGLLLLGFVMQQGILVP